jgi:hypothetical protein
VFPPVLIDVEAGSRKWQEMHVNGGTVAQLFLYSPGITASHDLRYGPLARERRAFIIRNARLDAKAVAVERSIFTIAGRNGDLPVHRALGAGPLRVHRLLLAIHDAVVDAVLGKRVPP